MKYKNIKKATFLNRPNRFIANIEIDGKKEVCHVKNTGRCRELLVEGCTVFVQECVDNPKRKTKYDLIGVFKGKRLVNMDSQAPNRVVQEYLPVLFPNLVFAKAEKKYKNSRFDFYVETKEEKIFIEVKGGTLEEEGEVRFPDAPTERGVKHIRELIDCIQDGYQAYIIFVVQMKGVTHFVPNRSTHPEFAEVLKEAKSCGVNVLCFDCRVKMDELLLDEPVEVRI